MKEIVKFVIKNAEKFEYDGDGRITNLQYFYDGDWIASNGECLAIDTRYRVAPKKIWTDDDMVEFAGSDFFVPKSKKQVLEEFKKRKEAGNETRKTHF